MKKRIEFGELRIGSTAAAHLMDCVNTNWASSGPKVKAFEKAWGERFGYKYNKAVSSGTDAVLNLVASLYDFGAQRGDEVIVPALSFIATSNAVLMAGFTPVFVDVKLEDMNIDESKIEAAITPRTRAILVVHTMGQVCNMTDILFIAAKHKLYVFEDACEAHGAAYGSYLVGRGSHGAAFSFYTAHLVNTGEGGMVSTNYEKVANSVGSTRSHGREEGSLYFDHVRLGWNSKMNDLEASLGLEGIRKFDETFAVRKKNWQRLVDAMEPFENLAWFSSEPRETRTSPHGFNITLKCGNIKVLCERLDDNNIAWKRNFGSIPTQHKAFSFMGYGLGDFPNAEYIGDNGIHIGTHQYLTEDDLDRIIVTLNEYFLGVLVGC